MPYTDSQLKEAVDKVFEKYDANKSGMLERGEATNLINDALKNMNSTRKVS